MARLEGGSGVTTVSAARGGRGLRVLATRLSLVATLLASTACSVSVSASRPERAAPSPAAAPIERDLALVTFDSAWSRIHNSYYDPDFRGIDWPGIRDELRPRAGSAATVGELRGVIGEMLGRLGESHFAVIPREQVDALEPGSLAGAAGASDAGLEFRWVDGEVMVSRVRPGGAAEAAGVRAGWTLDAIGERHTDRWKEALAQAENEVVRQGLRLGVLSRAHELLRGAEGATVRVEFRDEADRAQRRDLVLRPTPGERVQFGNLPAVFAHLEYERMPAPGGCVGMIRFNIWMLPVSAAFDHAIDSLAECRGIVLDLRGNAGGVAGMVMGIGGAFLNEAVPMGTMTTRQGDLRLVVNPRRVGPDGRPRQPFAGPLAVLIDEASMSTSEVFAAGLRSVGRARLFGARTPGYALPATMLRLPNDDVLFHAVANLTDPDGRRIEGRGVEPHVAVPLTRGDLLAGRDRALEEAVGWIGAQPIAAGS